MRLEIDGEYSGIKFSASHFIPGHAKCGRLHGHVYILRLLIHGEKDEHGMVMDFVILKKVLREISEELDHHLILPGNSDEMIISVGEEVRVETAGSAICSRQRMWSSWTSIKLALKRSRSSSFAD